MYSPNLAFAPKGKEKWTFVPITIPETSPENYITGLSALNLRDPDCWQSGDWHQRGSWFRAIEQIVPDSATKAIMSSDFRMGAPVNIMGDQRLCDARQGLGDLGHPDAKKPSRIWCAHHERAIADTAWMWMRDFPRIFPASVCAPTVAAFLWTDRQFENLHRLLDLLTPHVDIGCRDKWLSWKSELTQEADWR